MLGTLVVVVDEVFFFSFRLGFFILVLLYHLINRRTHIGFWLGFFFFFLENSFGLARLGF